MGYDSGHAVGLIVHILIRHHTYLTLIFCSYNPTTRDFLPVLLMHVKRPSDGTHPINRIAVSDVANSCS
jgi:hypothetical protein